MSKKTIYVTQPTLPDLDELFQSLKIIWDNKWITNEGEFHKEFEKRLSEYLGIRYISLLANGTLALMLALQVMRISGEVITTPYSFVATTHALWWNGIKPVFVDIEPETMNLNPEKIEAAITTKTTAIVPVHIYGNPCNIDKIQIIADTYGLKVIYDAAHAFGVEKNGESILNFGDLSVLSFHATKAFNTIEGGAVISHDAETKKRIDYLKNFGFVDEITVMAPGINGKMNELQAAYGLLQLKTFEEQISKRKKIAKIYRKLLLSNGIRFLEDIENVKHNYSHFPIFIDKNEYGHSRDVIYEELMKRNILTRRYFFPLISQFPTYRGLPSANDKNLAIAEKLSKEVICLPIYPDLKEEDVIKICNIINNIK